MIPTTQVIFTRIKSTGNQKRYPASPSPNLGFIKAVYNLAPPKYSDDYYDPNQDVVHVYNVREIAAEQIKASDKAGVPAAIDGGWAVERFTFSAIVSERNTRTARTINLIIGYTEPTQTITDDTKLYVTRVIRLGTMLYASPEGQTSVGRIMNDDLVIGSGRSHAPVDSGIDSVTRDPSSKRPTMRPEDFFTDQIHYTAPETVPPQSPSENWLDMRVYWKPSCVLSAVINEDIPSYLERILLAYRAGRESHDVFSDARHTCRNIGFTNYSFFSDLMRSTEFCETGCFTLGEMKSIQSDAVDVTVSNETLTANFTGTDDSLESFVASRIVGMVNGHLIHGGFKRIDVSGGPGGINIAILESLDICLEQKREFRDELTKRLELFSMLEGVTNVTYSLTLDIMGFADITLSINDNPKHSFTIPMFAYGALSAMLT